MSGCLHLGEGSRQGPAIIDESDQERLKIFARQMNSCKHVAAEAGRMGVPGEVTRRVVYICSTNFAC